MIAVREPKKNGRPTRRVTAAHEPNETHAQSNTYCPVCLGQAWQDRVAHDTHCWVPRGLKRSSDADWRGFMLIRERSFNRPLRWAEVCELQAIGALPHRRLGEIWARVTLTKDSRRVVIFTPPGSALAVKWFPEGGA